ncbi:Putative UPF0259 membrane protein YciC [Buchnera aphidicola (Panaphis juglandis)]
MINIKSYIDGILKLYKLRNFFIFFIIFNIIKFIFFTFISPIIALLCIAIIILYINNNYYFRALKNIISIKIYNAFMIFLIAIFVFYNLKDIFFMLNMIIFIIIITFFLKNRI